MTAPQESWLKPLKKMSDKRRHRQWEYKREIRQKVKNDFLLYFKEKHRHVRARVKTPGYYFGMEVMPIEIWIKFVEDSRAVLEPMFEKWKMGGFQRGDAPSIDRIDSSKGYVLENCRWLPQSLNAYYAATKKGRKQKVVVPITHCINGHEFTADNIYSYRNSRHCRECVRENQKRYESTHPGRENRTHKYMNVGSLCVPRYFPNTQKWENVNCKRCLHIRVLSKAREVKK